MILHTLKNKKLYDKTVCIMEVQRLLEVLRKNPNHQLECGRPSVKELRLFV